MTEHQMWIAEYMLRDGCTTGVVARILGIKEEAVGAFYKKYLLLNKNKKHLPKRLEWIGKHTWRKKATLRTQSLKRRQSWAPAYSARTQASVGLAAP